MNRVVLSGQLVERDAVRYTPAGIPACGFGLKNESQVTEAGQPRKVFFEIRAVALGDLAHRLLQLELGTKGTFAGFLTNMRNGRGTLFHVTEFEPVQD